MLYDISARKVLHEYSITDAKNVYWSHNFAYAVIISKTCKILLCKYCLEIVMVNKNLELMNSQKENSRIKTGCFDEN